MKMTKQQICIFFNCSMDQLNAQYKANAATLNTMRIKAKDTGKKINGFNESQLTAYTNKYINLAK